MNPEREESLAPEDPQADKLALLQQAIKCLGFDQVGGVAPAATRLVKAKRPPTVVRSSELRGTARISDKARAVRDPRRQHMA